MFNRFSLKTTVMFIVVVSLAIQVGFALGVFGPAWLSPILTLPALFAMARLWQRAEQERAETEAFTELVI